MANLTIYVSEELRADIRRLRIATSQTCQQALRAEVKRVERDIDRRAKLALAARTKQQEAK